MWGTFFLVRLVDCDSSAPVDVSDATSVRFVFSNRQGRRLEVSGTFTTDGTDGQVQYATVSGDLDVDGRWVLQVVVVTPDGSWSSNVRVFQVVGNL
jgi:hypothetical protein